MFSVRHSFTDVYAGWPGSTCSAAVLSSSDLYLKAEDRPDGYLFPREVSRQVRDPDTHSSVLPPSGGTTEFLRVSVAAGCQQLHTHTHTDDVRCCLLKESVTEGSGPYLPRRFPIMPH